MPAAALSGARSPRRPPLAPTRSLAVRLPVPGHQASVPWPRSTCLSTRHQICKSNPECSVPSFLYLFGGTEAPSGFSLNLKSFFDSAILIQWQAYLSSSPEKTIFLTTRTFPPGAPFRFARAVRRKAGLLSFFSALARRALLHLLLRCTIIALLCIVTVPRLSAVAAGSPPAAFR